MSEQAIAIYCFIDDFLKTVGHKTDGHCKVRDAEIMTTALIAARYFMEIKPQPECICEKNMGLA